MKDKTFQKIIFLSGCILTFLLVCLYDTYTNKQQTILTRLSETLQTELGKLDDNTNNDSDSNNNSETAYYGTEAVKIESPLSDSTGKKAKESEEEKENGTSSNVKSVDNKNAQDESLITDNPSIRVVIKTDNFEGVYHDSVSMQCSTDYVIQYGDKKEEHTASEPITLTKDSPYFTGDTIRIQTKDRKGEISFPQLKRGYENPSYLGDFEIVKGEEGLLVINELPLETYLCSVVPSEMPAGYPLESLKAQAICARSYALKQMNMGRAAEFNADVDDSVSYQVYNNQGRNENTTKAVQETAGQVMKENGEIVDALYYSTSCGIDLKLDLSKETTFASFMTTDNKKAYEATEPWYRWMATFQIEELTRLVNETWQEGFGTVTGLEIKERESSGAIDTLIVKGSNQNIEIEGEYAIRKLLSPTNVSVKLQDGSEAPDMGLLPSAFFYLTPNYDGEALTGYTLIGGGYGHGKGMSQNGARHMADAGMKYDEILKYYYGKIEIG